MTCIVNNTVLETTTTSGLLGCCHSAGANVISTGVTIPADVAAPIKASKTPPTIKDLIALLKTGDLSLTEVKGIASTMTFNELHAKDQSGKNAFDYAVANGRDVVNALNDVAFGFVKETISHLTGVAWGDLLDEDIESEEEDESDEDNESTVENMTIKASYGPHEATMNVRMSHGFVICPPPPSPPRHPAIVTITDRNKNKMKMKTLNAADLCPPPPCKPMANMTTTGETASMAKTTTLCRFFKSKKGCRNGDACRFVHESRDQPTDGAGWQTVVGKKRKPTGRSCNGRQ